MAIGLEGTWQRSNRGDRDDKYICPATFNRSPSVNGIEGELKAIELGESAFSIFPRSPQYELWYIRNERLKNAEKYRGEIVECPKKEETLDTDDEPCGLLKPPIWWKDKETRKPSSLTVANINDYALEKLKDFGQHDVKLSEKLHMDHPRKYIPGVIRRLQNPEDTSMMDALEKADAFEDVAKGEETLPEVVVPPVDEPCDKCQDEDVKVADKSILHGDSRWQPLRENVSLPKTELKREKKFRELTKSFQHDLHKWYTKNKPTELIVPVRHLGKKAIPERRFSHL
ncbi:hypothetical protein WH47_11696 [Habropoda laboriosa]|uniref:Uncharacterized protein n=1 Tax=Habropoda laboriosa TaxID=597456 RepID=A0A0L7R888_9HYME|nr:hypothetical protein WH47_11696 [Habropoda laboriosa]